MVEYGGTEFVEAVKWEVQCVEASCAPLCHITRLLHGGLAKAAARVGGGKWDDGSEMVGHLRA
jgi:hypothetical protein